MGFFEKIKKVFESEDNFESHNKDDRNNKDELAESLKNDNSNEKKEIKYRHSEESVLNGKVSDEQAMVRNFKYLDDLIHSGVKEIVLDSDIVLGSDEESQYLEGIKLDVDDLTIDGNGFTVDARVETRIFYCTGKNIIIRNITLKNGFTKKDGGAIYNDDGGSLTITESALQENTAPKGAG